MYFYNIPTRYLYQYDSRVMTITGSDGKNPPRLIKFTNAFLESYTGPLIAQSYEDTYSLEEKELTVNGVVFDW